MSSEVDISEYAVASRPPLRDEEVSMGRAYFYDGRICRIISVAFGTDGRTLEYITGTESTHRVEYEEFQENAHFIGFSNQYGSLGEKMV